MNVAFALRVTKAEFETWLENQDRKHEWKEGRVVQMPNVTKAHARIVSNFVGALRNRLDLDLWSVTASDLGVEDVGFIRFPDVVVEPLDADDKGRRALSPVLIVEVLSPSSVAVDLIEKVQEYSLFQSLGMYIVASQDEPIFWVFEREGASGDMPVHPIECNGRDQTIEIKAIGVTLPLAEIYRGVGA